MEEEGASGFGPTHMQGVVGEMRQMKHADASKPSAETLHPPILRHQKGLMHSRNHQPHLDWGCKPVCLHLVQNLLLTLGLLHQVGVGTAAGNELLDVAAVGAKAVDEV